MRFLLSLLAEDVCPECVSAFSILPHLLFCIFDLAKCERINNNHEIGAKYFKCLRFSIFYRFSAKLFCTCYVSCERFNELQFIVRATSAIKTIFF